MHSIKVPTDSSYSLHSTVQRAEGVAGRHIPTFQQLLQALLMPCVTNDRRWMTDDSLTCDRWTARPYISSLYIIILC